MKDETRTQKFERIKGEAVTLTAKQKADLMQLLTAPAVADQQANLWRDLVYLAAADQLAEAVGGRPAPLPVVLTRIHAELSQATNDASLDKI